jgi:hypothetical protein
MVWQQRRMLFVETSMYFPLMRHQRYLWMGSLKTALAEKQHIFSARSLASKKYALFTKMQSEWYFALWSLRIPDVQLQPWRHCKDINLMKLIMTHMHCASHLLDIQALVGLLGMIHIEGVEIVLMITTSDLEEAVTKIHFASNAGVPSILESVLTHLLPLNP